MSISFAQKLRHSLSLQLCLLSVTGISALVGAAYFTLRPLQQIYEEVSFDQAKADALISRLKTGVLKAHNDGSLALPNDLVSCSKNECAYVTFSGQKMSVLLPSYMDHDTSNFIGYLYSDDLQTTILPGSIIKVIGPTRATLNGPGTRAISLTVGKNIGAFWHQVYGNWH